MRELMHQVRAEYPERLPRIPKGRIAWFLPDPRDMHVYLAEGVIGRVLKEKTY